MSTDRPHTIRLDQFLKIIGAVATGGQAKLLIQSGEVSVNGVTENRRRRQLEDGDVVSLEGNEFTVEIIPEDDEPGV